MAFAVTWLSDQLSHFAKTLKTADDMDTEDAKQISLAIISNYSSLNLAEVMLFFSRLAGGIYGQVAFGTLRAENITSKIPIFAQQRAKELERYERAQETFERNREAETRQKHAITYQEYQRILAEQTALCQGDEEKAREIIAHSQPKDDTQWQYAE